MRAIPFLAPMVALALFAIACDGDNPFVKNPDTGVVDCIEDCDTDNPIDEIIKDVLISTHMATGKWQWDDASEQSGKVVNIEEFEVEGADYTVTNGIDSYDGVTTDSLDLKNGEWTADYEYTYEDTELTARVIRNIGETPDLFEALCPDLRGEWSCYEYSSQASMDSTIEDHGSMICLNGPGCFKPNGLVMDVYYDKHDEFPLDFDYSRGVMMNQEDIWFHAEPPGDRPLNWHCWRD